MRKVAKNSKVMLLVSFFEQAGPCYFNSVVLIDADGNILKDKDGKDRYRKSHIPDGPGYQEKYYFSPGDTGFSVWNTPIGNIGCAICWDQWFPESARIMSLMGADIICYPTAIGSEPVTGVDTREQWQRVMQGHAAANVIPVIAANRIGVESDQDTTLAFYGSSFITDSSGKIIDEAPSYNGGDVDNATAVISAEFDFNLQKSQRNNWGLFRDRRPDLYGPLLTLSGNLPRQSTDLGASTSTQEVKKFNVL